jgi:hypothetical protein
MLSHDRWRRRPLSPEMAGMTHKQISDRAEALRLRHEAEWATRMPPTNTANEDPQEGTLAQLGR